MQGCSIRSANIALVQILPAILFMLCIILRWSGRRKLTICSLLFLSGCILLPAIGQLLQVLFYGGAYVNAMATIAFLDIGMGTMNGITMAKQLKALWPEIRSRSIITGAII